MCKGKLKFVKKGNIIALPKCVVFFLLIANGCKQRDKERCHEFNKYAKIIENFRNSKDTSVLISTLDDIIPKDAQCLDAYLARGDLYLSLGNDAKAKKDFKTALLLSNKNVYVLYKMGMLYQDEELYDSSVFFFQQEIEIKTHNGVMVDYPKGVNELSTDENKYDIQSIEIFYRQGVSYYYGRNLLLALKNFDYCIDNNYLLGKTYLYRGAIQEELNRKSKACEDFLQSKI